MHPILGHMRQLGLYLLAWIPLAVLLLYLLASPGGISLPQAIGMVLPLCLIYAFMCLSAWYSCRGAPLGTSTFSRLALTHLLAALVISGIWVLIARGLASVLASLQMFRGLDQRFAPDYPLLFASGVMIYLLAVALHYLLLSVEHARELEKREIQARVLARDSELKALKAQVNPHFLFNSLNSISALTSIDAGRARDMCILLADFLRMTLGLGEKALVPLREELELLRRFLAIEKVRLGERLHVDAHIEAQAETCLLPPLLLQPLVENAIIHGVATLPTGGTVRLSAECSGGRLHLSVENSVDPDAPAPRKGGLGLANVRLRLEARYGKDATLRATAEEELFRVTISLPAEMADTPKQSVEHELAPAKEARA